MVSMVAPAPVRRADLAVTMVHGMGALERYAAQIDRLNLASARPNALLSAAYLQCYAKYVEYFIPDRDERLVLVHEGEQLIGCVPMRSSTDNFGTLLGRSGLWIARFGFLAPVDIEQPGLLCAPEDEERVAAAVVRHFCTVECNWGMLEFAGQRPGGALHRTTHAAAGGRLRSRDIPVEPFNEIPLAWPDVATYFKSLSKKMRSNIGRQTRRLYAAGATELILAQGAAATSAWFDAYLELEDRSWKQGTISALQRHPRRVQFYREIVAGRGGLDPSFIGVVLDGVLVAGLIVGDNSVAAPGLSGAWCLEMAYDRARADLGPGQVLLLLAVAEGIRRGNRFLNLLQMFAYYKHRWKAEPIEVVNVQLLRRFSLHDVRASLGDLKRRLRPERAPAAPVASEDDCGDEAAVAPNAPPANFDRARQLAATACATAGSGMLRLDRAQARERLPFPLD
jgi:Acetyltransferase (GNAT) domain